MCGIVGVLSTELNTNTHPYGKFFQQALFTDTLRGFDSTGIMLKEDKSAKLDIWKKAMAAPDFLQLSRTKSMFSGMTNWHVMVGHNRAATRGAVKDHTAHPFQFGDITMVHNGTVYNHRSLPGGNTFDVDSEAIAYAIAQEGPDAVVEKLDGAFTLVWHDNSDGTVNLVRNEERPLAIATVKGKNTLLISSEGPMLRWLAMRNGLIVDKIVEPKPGELFTFNPCLQDEDTWLEKSSSRTLKLRPKHTAQQRTGGTGWTGYGTAAGTKGGAGKKSTGNGNNVTPINQRSQSLTSSGGQSGQGLGGKKAKEPSEETVAIFRQLGLEMGDLVVLSNLSWKQYPKSKHKEFGYVVGQVDDLDEHFTVGLVHGIQRTIFHRDIADKHIYADITGCSVDERGNAIVYVDNTDYTIEDPEKVSTVDHTKEDDKATPVATFRITAGHYVTADAFADLTRNGCSQCGEPINAKDHEKTGWTSSKRPVCKRCITDLNMGRCLN